MSGNRPDFENNEVIKTQPPTEGAPSLATSFCRGLKQFTLLPKHPVPRGGLSLLGRSVCLKQEAKATSTARSHFSLENT